LVSKKRALARSSGIGEPELEPPPQPATFVTTQPANASVAQPAQRQAFQELPVARVRPLFDCRNRIGIDCSPSGSYQLKYRYNIAANGRLAAKHNGVKDHVSETLFKLKYLIEGFSDF
jgi:hypothetical protein